MPAKRIGRRVLALAIAAGLAGIGAGIGAATGAEVEAAPKVVVTGPAGYLAAVARLRAGQELRLAPGIYTQGLWLEDLHGTPGRPIVISGPADRSAVFLGRPLANTVELRKVSHLELRNLTLDGRNLPGTDGIKAQDVTHDITLENLEVVNHALHQQIVAISTKAPAWNWVIRGNVIRNAGTGLYLGESDGSAPFIHGLIEGNLITGTIGYGLQIKHQRPRPDLPGLPPAPGATVIRDNIISKARQPMSGFQGPRPNLLVGHLPLEGPGAEDVYEIYGNLLYENLVDEPLFQGEGNIAFHDNLLVNRHGDAVHIRPHNDKPRDVSVFHNTIVAKGTGIRLAGGYADFRQLVARNAVFAERPVTGGEQRENLVNSYAAAQTFLKAPFADWPALDLRPRPGAERRSKLPPDTFANIANSERDFAGNPRKRDQQENTFPGAYAGPEVAKQGLLRFPPTL